jgi:hypothetical protein
MQFFQPDAGARPIPPLEVRAKGLSIPVEYQIAFGQTPLYLSLQPFGHVAKNWQGPR